MTANRPNHPERTCTATLKQFARRQFTRWQGLASGCTLPDLDALCPRDDDWVGRGMLGGRQYRYVWLSAAGYKEPVRVWLDNDRLVLLETDLPNLANPRRLLSKLGEPNARLDAYRDTVPVPHGEWVYVERGLTLFVYPPGDVIYHLAAYPPCTLEEYRRELRPDLKVTHLRLGPLDRNLDL
jgi:hypothetical protein